MAIVCQLMIQLIIAFHFLELWEKLFSLFVQNVQVNFYFLALWEKNLSMIKKMSKFHFKHQTGMNKINQSALCNAGDLSIGTMTMTILKIYWTDKSLDWLNRHKTLWTVLFRTEWLFRKGPSCQPDFIYVQSKYVFWYLSSHNWGPFFKFANNFMYS